MTAPQFKAAFHCTVTNPSAPGGKIDMYLVHDDATGEGLITLGVPHGDKETPARVVKSVNCHEKFIATLKSAKAGWLYAQGNPEREYLASMIVSQIEAIDRALAKAGA